MKKLLFSLLLCLIICGNSYAVITAGNYTLKASGGDYATLKDFLNDLGNLTGDLTLTVDAGTYNETVLAGAVTESLNGYTLWIKPASFPTTTDGTTGVIFNVNVGAGANFIQSQVNGAGTFIIEGLNFTYTTNRPHYIAAIYSAAAGYNFIIRRCVFKQAYEGAIYIYDGDPTYNIYNNVIIKSEGASVSYGIYVRGINFKGYISNNTVIDVAGVSTGYGLGQESAGNTGLFENNLVYNSKTSDFRNVGSCTGNNNASKDATADDFGTGGSWQISIADPFANSATYDLTLVTGSPVGNGKDLSGSFTTDFFGNTRSTWDIGACAYVAPASTIKKYDGVAYADIKKIDGVAIANVK